MTAYTLLNSVCRAVNAENSGYVDRILQAHFGYGLGPQLRGYLSAFSRSSELPRQPVGARATLGLLHLFVLALVQDQQFTELE